MIGTLLGKRLDTFGDELDRLGGIPADRVLLDPRPGTATEADLIELTARTRCRLELVAGTLVERAGSAWAGMNMVWLGARLIDAAEPDNLGIVAQCGPVHLAPGLVRRPGLSFVRWDSTDDPDEIECPTGEFLEVPPDLVVEAVCPGNTPAEMAIKLGEYAAAGVNLVWHVDPDRKEVTVYPKGKERGKKVVGLDGVLDGGAVLPGFTLPVATIFAKRAPAKKPGRKGKK